MITIWHNPRCSKSRQALALIEQSTHAVTVRRYLEDTPTEAEIRDVLAMLDLPASDLLRGGEKLAKELGLTRSTDTARLVAAMALHPILIERPLVMQEDRAVIGRPPENVQRLL